MLKELGCHGEVVYRQAAHRPSRKCDIICSVGGVVLFRPQPQLLIKASEDSPCQVFSSWLVNAEHTDPSVC